MEVGFTPRKPDKPYEIVPAGVHLGYLYRIVYAGWCENKNYNNYRQKFRLDFELHPCDDDTGEWKTMADGRPWSIAPGFRGWLAGKRLAGILDSWKGVSTIQSELILGQPAMISVVHRKFKRSDGTDGLAPDVTSITPAPQRFLKDAPEPVNLVVEYNIDSHDDDTFALLPKFIREFIQRESQDYIQRFGPPSVHQDGEPGGELDEDIPF